MDREVRQDGFFNDFDNFLTILGHVPTISHQHKKSERSCHGLLESPTGHFNITIRNKKTNALISKWIDDFNFF